MLQSQSQSRSRPRRGTDRIGVAIWLGALLCGQAAMSADAPLAPEAPTSTPPVVRHVPLCAGLKVVTAVSQKDGDYESIKTLETVTPQAQRIKYSSESMTQDIFSTEPPKLERVSVYRQVLTRDQKSAIAYMEQFSRVLPEQIEGTTAIGASSLVLKQLKSQPQVTFGFYQALVEGGGPIPASRGGHPNVYDYQMLGKIHRVEAADVMLPVIVNDVPSLMPAVHAAGTFFGDKAEFYFLDDPVDPLTLKFRFGIDAVTPAPDPEHPDLTPARRDRDDLLVTKISFDCADAPSVNSIEQQLSATGKADVYDIYFSFNSDQIRDESESSLKQIADALNDHSDWKLAVNGHTDNIGGDAYNLTLSKKRAEAVKAALVGRLHIQPARLVTDGFGASQPKDTNVTLQGRAHNRRVELIRR